MQACCQKDKGWKLVELPVGADDTSVPTEGLYNLRVVNQGDVTLKIQSIEVTPGNCMSLGIDWLPCAQALNCEWSDESGQKKAVVIGASVIDFCCD